MKRALSLILVLMLVAQNLAFVSIESDAATEQWIWEPSVNGYSGANCVTCTNNSLSGYTTFTATGADPYVYPGVAVGNLSATTSLGKFDADTLRYGVVRYRTYTCQTAQILANADKSLEFVQLPAYNGTGEWTDYKFDSNFTGSVNWFRFDTIDGEVGSVDIAFVAFFDTDANREIYLANRAMPHSKVVDIEFSESGIIDNLNEKYGPVTGSATSYTKDSVTNIYTANFDNYLNNSYAIKSAPIPMNVLDIMSVTSSYEIYFKMTPSNQEETVFSAMESAGVGLYSPETVDTIYKFYICDDAGYTALTVRNVAVDTWYHMVIVVNNKIATMYVNGVIVDTQTLSSDIVWTNADGYTPNTFVIGGDISASGDVTEHAENLSVGFFRIYAQALTTADVLAAYESLHPKYNVTVGTVENGTITVSPIGEVKEGTKVTITATPDEGYVLDTIYVNGNPIGFAAVNTFTITDDAVVTALFRKLKCTVSVGTVTNGTVTLSKTGNVDYESTLTITATPDEGYVLDQIWVNGTAYGCSTVTTFTVTDDAVVTASFKKLQHTISIGTVTNGTVTTSAIGVVDYGTTVTITATPDEGYILEQIFVNGSAITKNTFIVTDDVVVTASFKKLQYTISIGTVTNGTVTTSAIGVVDYGTTVTITATPADGYALDKILVNGTAITGTTFTVTGDSVVTASFKKLQYTVSIGTVTNGTVTTSAIGVVDYGTTVTVSATPADGYVLDQIFVNGSAITNNTFTVTDDAVVTATFKLMKYNVSVGSVSNGTVTASATGSVDYGATITVTTTPAAGYQLDAILVNGTAISGTTFEVTADSVVTATFKKITGSVGNILIDKMNYNIWAQPYNTIIFDDTYAGPYRSPWQYTLVCRYNSVLGKYVVEEKYVPKGNSNTSFSLAPNQIIINTLESSESYKACSSVWAATDVGSVLTLSGVDLVNQTVAAGAYAAVENGVEIPSVAIISVGSVENGTIELSEYGEVDLGTNVTVTTKPDPGYELEAILVNGVPFTGNAFCVYDHSIVTATFKKIESYSVSVGDVTNGTVTIVATGSIDYGTTITVKTIPDTGYELDKIYVNGVAIDGSSFIIEDVSNFVVTATFKPLSCYVSVGEVENGVISLNMLGSVTYGDVITVTSIADTDYALEKIYVNGIAISGNTFTVTGDSVVTATFKSLKCYVSIASSQNGMISTTALGSIYTGTQITVTAIPDEGYQLDKILVNGEAIFGYSFTAYEDSVVTAIFKKAMCYVSVGGSENGTVYLSKTGEVDCDTVVTVTAVADSGYILDEIYINGTAISGKTFVVTCDTVVTATFKVIKCNVSIGNVTNGTVSTSVIGSVDAGTVVTVTAVPDDGYSLDAIFVNGVAIENITFIVTEDVVIVATFVDDSCPIGLEYEITGETVSITGYTGNSDMLIIPEQIAGYPVTAISTRAFYKCTSLLYVELTGNVKYIHDAAFEECSSLREVIICDSVERIGLSSFRGCTNLEKITIPFVGETTFSPNNTNFGYIFGASNYMQNSYRVPASLKKVVISNAVTIDQAAFYGCESLETIFISESVMEIGAYAFDNCTNLTAINVSKFNEFYSSVEGVLYNASKTTLIKYPAGKVSSLLIMPNTVTIIDDYAFENTIGLAGVSISENVVSIGREAFSGCSGLNIISIPKNVRRIGNRAFEGCSKLVDIHVDAENQHYTERSGVLYSKDMKTLVAYPVGRSDTSCLIPNCVENIYVSAFYGSQNITSINIPLSVTYIGEYAFRNCKNLTNIYYGGLEADWMNITVEAKNDVLETADVKFDCAISVIENSNLALSSDNLSINGIETGSVTSAVLSNFETNEEIRVVDIDGNVVTSDSVIGTGYKIQRVIDDVIVDELEAVVTGDTDGDGQVTVSDTQIAYNHLMGTETIDGVYEEAAKISGNSSISILDIMALFNMM